MRGGALAAAIAMILVSGCSSAPAADPQQSGAQQSGASSAASASGAAGFWSRSRLLGAQPLLGGQRPVPLPGQTPDARTAAVALRVGALFEHDASGAHFCTASVVESPGQDLLITAAHCINDGSGSGNKTDIVFIPDYRDGTAPYGIWTPQRLVVAPQWANSADPDFDVGFVVLQPHDGENIEQVLGANQLGFDSGYHYLVRVTGYPSGGGAPITCLNWTSRQSVTQLEFDCGGYTGGTSGSPWVIRYDTQSRTGTVVGVIGGYQQGGDTPSISYSPYFGRGIQQLYQQAISLRVDCRVHGLGVRRGAAREASGAGSGRARAAAVRLHRGDGQRGDGVGGAGPGGEHDPQVGRCQLLP
jgi:V8-like Glu-specific endopeptidase